MKKKLLKILPLCLAILLLTGCCAAANSFWGNPVSKALAGRAAKAYLAQQFADTDYRVERVGYSFKFGCYFAHIRSESSVDTQFSLSIDMRGQVYADSYDDVLSGAVTARRLEQAYRDLTAQVLDDDAFPYPGDIRFGTLEICPQEAFDDPQVTNISSYALVQQELVIDREYDIRQLGRQAGHLIVYVDGGDVTAQAAAEMLLAIRALFDEADIPFRSIDLTLHHPLPQEGPRPEGSVSVSDFAYEDIYAQDLEQRVAAADKALKAYYAALDAEEKSEGERCPRRFSPPYPELQLTAKQQLYILLFGGDFFFAAHGTAPHMVGLVGVGAAADRQAVRRGQCKHLFTVVLVVGMGVDRLQRIHTVGIWGADAVPQRVCLHHSDAVPLCVEVKRLRRQLKQILPQGQKLPADAVQQKIVASQGKLRRKQHAKAQTLPLCPGPQVGVAVQLHLLGKGQVAAQPGKVSGGQVIGDEHGVVPGSVVQLYHCLRLQVSGAAERHGVHMGLCLEHSVLHILLFGAREFLININHSRKYRPRQAKNIHFFLFDTIFFWRICYT